MINVNFVERFIFRMVEILFLEHLTRFFSLLAIADTALPFSKNYASFCYSCVSKYPSYSWVNESAIVDYLRSKDINVPEGNEKCNERHAIEEFPEFKEIPGVFCPLGVCVKLKGVVWHPEDRKIKEFFVVRHCWDKMWDKPYDVRQWYNCSNVDYMSDIEGQMCSCHYDLCNKSSSLSFSVKIIVSILIVLTVHCTT